MENETLIDYSFGTRWKKYKNEIENRTNYFIHILIFLEHNWIWNIVKKMENETKWPSLENHFQIKSKNNNKFALTGRHASSKSAACLCINENDYWQQELRI